MKKALKLFLAYFIWLIIGTLVGTFFYSLYLHSLELVAGVNSPVFSSQHLTKSFFLISQVLTFISGFLILGYKIRKPGSSLQLLVYVICQFLSICILFPVSSRFEKKYGIGTMKFYQKEDKALSPGYFRESNDQVYFFLNEKNNRLIQIDTRDNGTSIYKENTYAPLNELSKKAAPYKDVLIKDSFRERTSLYSFLSLLIEAGKRDMSTGLSFWLGFLSVGLALTSIYALSSFSAWRIINYSLCALHYGLILFVNGFYWSPLLAGFRNCNFLHSGFFGFMNRWTSAPLLILINIIFALILAVSGTIKFIITKKRGR